MKSEIQLPTRAFATRDERRFIFHAAATPPPRHAPRCLLDISPTLIAVTGQVAMAQVWQNTAVIPVINNYRQRRSRHRR
jgi:hypothetical protein